MIQWMDNLGNKIFTREILIILLAVQNILGICVIFSNPLPIPPKTSIGLLTGIMLLMVLLFIILLKKKTIQIQGKLFLVDWLVLGYIIASAISLIVSPYIFELTSFRLLLVAVTQYAAVRLLCFSEKEKQQTINIVGITTVCIGAISLFQIIFRDQSIVFAKRFLFGDSSFSIAQDLTRGRGPQWGDIVVSFPFFIGSAFFLRKSRLLLHRVYVLFGIFLIPFSFIVSNFRWLTMCFFIGVSLCIVILKRNRLLPMTTVKKIFVSFVFAVVGGMILASVVFQYNLIDRFLLKVKERDFTFTVGRLFLYQQAFSAFSASPIFGIGMGSYRYAIERPPRLHYYQIITEEGSVDIEKRETVSSHNDLLTILAETGGFGALMYLGLNFLIIKRLVYTLRRSVREQNHVYIVSSLVIFTSLVMFYLIGLFENSAPNNYVFVFFLYAASVTWFPFFKQWKSREVKM